MDNLAYRSQDIAFIGRKVEEKVREAIGASSPLTYEVEINETGTANTLTLLLDMGTALFPGGRASGRPLCQFKFDLDQPRSARLQVNVNRKGMGSHVGMLVYFAPLGKSVSGVITLEDPHIFGPKNHPMIGRRAKFTGPAAQCSRLNANRDLIKAAHDFTRDETLSESRTTLCKILPQENGSKLVIAAVPKPLMMGLDAAIRAKDFFAIANMIETTL
jgi:hypothetical protein